MVCESCITGRSAKVLRSKEVVIISRIILVIIFWRDQPFLHLFSTAENRTDMTDQSLSFFNTFINLCQEIIGHDGYGDIAVSIRVMPGQTKEVRLRCGKEYRYLLVAPKSPKEQKKYRVIEDYSDRRGYQGPERRSLKDRRDYGHPRRAKGQSRSFRLERRVSPDRRKGRGRRHDD